MSTQRRRGPHDDIVDKEHGDRASISQQAADAEISENEDNDIEIVYPTKGGDISLKSQQPLVRRALSAAIVKVKLDILFDNAYPLALKTDGACTALLACARRLTGAEHMVARMLSDSDYLETLAGIVRALSFESNDATC